MHEVLVYRLGGLSLPRKSVVMLTDRPDTTLDVCSMADGISFDVSLSLNCTDLYKRGGGA